jgi:glycine/sarcosine N-methyltransferase
LNSSEFYDRLARAFDVMTDWESRLARELPFIEEVLGRQKAKRVLDVACGTGWHSIALAQRGYTAAGCDASPKMIERAKENAKRAGVALRFETADFTGLDIFAEPFDAVLCLGNSLPHLLSQEALVEAIRRMRGRLTPAGVLILHNLNYDRRMKAKPRFFSANGTADALVWRFADYGPEFITFHTALFERKLAGNTGGAASWSVEVNSTLQRPLLAADLEDALNRAGFVHLKYFGGLDGSAFDREKSADLVMVATAGP